MKILDRYVARELLGPFLFGLCLFILVIVSGEYLFKLTKLVALGAPFLPIVELFWLRVVTVSVLCLPMAVLLSTLLTFGRLSSESELTAIQAGGIPLTRVACAPIVFGIVVSILGFCVNEFVVPPAGRLSRKIEDMLQTQLRNELIPIVVVGLRDHRLGRVLSRTIERNRRARGEQQGAAKNATDPPPASAIGIHGPGTYQQFTKCG